MDGSTPMSTWSLVGLIGLWKKRKKKKKKRGGRTLRREGYGRVQGGGVEGWSLGRYYIYIYEIAGTGAATQ